VSHLVISAIEIAGVVASDDFVKIYNPTQSAVDISGWKLRKKSSTGNRFIASRISDREHRYVGRVFRLGIERERFRAVDRRGRIKHGNARGK